VSITETARIPFVLFETESHRVVCTADGRDVLEQKLVDAMHAPSWSFVGDRKNTGYPVDSFGMLLDMLRIARQKIDHYEDRCDCHGVPEYKEIRT
jgi:hypothetical protein